MERAPRAPPQSSRFSADAVRTSRGVRGRNGYSAAAMAVPKRKTSKARRDQRRAQHGIEAPRVNACPQCGSPKRPHHICPTCGTYKGREVEPLRIDAP